MLGVVAAGLGAALALTGCSSSSNSADPDAGGLFGGTSSSSSTKATTGSHSESSHATASGSGASGSSGVLGKKACGTPPPSDWCTSFAPVLSNGSNILCEDFDQNAALDGDYGYIGVTHGSWVGGNFISPYCALELDVPDGGNTLQGSYSYHAYPVISQSTGGLTAAFDVNVANTEACNGVTLARIWVSPHDSITNAAMAWMNVTNIITSGVDKSYTLNVYALGATRPDGGMQGTPSSPASVTVTPGAAGWARVELNVTSFSVSATSATIVAEASWNAAGDVKTEGLSSSAHVNSTGVLAAAPAEIVAGEVAFGVLPDPTTGVAISGCEVLIDNAVSNYIAP